MRLIPTSITVAPDFTMSAPKSIFFISLFSSIFSHLSSYSFYQLFWKVDLYDKRKNRAKDLSGGQKQRLAIARAIVGDPQIIFADEPTGNLDSETGAKVEELLFDYNKQKGVTLIVVTHDADLAKKCDHQIIIKDGRIEKSTVPGERKNGC